MMLSSLFLALHKFVEERMMMMVAITHFMIVKNAYRNEEKRKKRDALKARRKECLEPWLHSHRQCLFPIHSNLKQQKSP